MKKFVKHIRRIYEQSIEQEISHKNAPFKHQPKFNPLKEDLMKSLKEEGQQLVKMKQKKQEKQEK
jgi:hypothetical protein